MGRGNGGNARAYFQRERWQHFDFKAVIGAAAGAAGQWGYTWVVVEREGACWGMMGGATQGR
ncbi:MAG: hypothetical protein IPQ26_10565 [Elusimicrobia bacterium]|nr:hypothetical protein [Elusimicrobiota bacterium]